MNEKTKKKKQKMISYQKIEKKLFESVPSTESADLQRQSSANKIIAKRQLVLKVNV